MFAVVLVLVVMAVLAVAAAYAVAAGTHLPHRGRDSRRLGTHDDRPQTHLRRAREWGPLVAALGMFVAMLAITLRAG
jgi:H+/Cl- antiporter ClcA